MAGVNVEARLGEHSAHIANIREEQARLRTALEDLTKSHRTLVSKGEAIETKLDAYLDTQKHDYESSYIVRMIRNNLDRISIWLILVFVLIQLVGKENALQLIGNGLLGT